MPYLDCIMCDTSFNIGYHKSIIDGYGITLSYDAFGNKNYVDSLWPGTGVVTDRERVKALLELINSGYEKKIVVSEWGMDRILSGFFHSIDKFSSHSTEQVVIDILVPLKSNGQRDSLQRLSQDVLNL